jgi:hypothetical protein
VQGDIEITALNLLQHTTVKVIRRRSDVMEVRKASGNVNRGFISTTHPLRPSPHSKMAMTLHEAEKEAAKVKPLMHQEPGFSAFRSGMASKI